MRQHANWHSIAILRLHGWSDEAIGETLGGRAVKWERYVPREIWEGFGDGRDFDALMAEDDARLDAERVATAERNERERADPESLMFRIAKGLKREETEAHLGGSIDDVVWEKAEKLAQPYLDRFAENRSAPIAEVLAAEIEEVDDAQVASGFVPVHWTTFVRVLGRGSSLATVKASYGVKEGLSVDARNAPPEVVAALRAAGLPVAA